MFGLGVSDAAHNECLEDQVEPVGLFIDSVLFLFFVKCRNDQNINTSFMCIIFI